MHAAFEGWTVLGCRSAEERATVLLRRWLTPEQRASYDAHGHFDVTGSSGTRYRIRSGQYTNVAELDQAGNEVAWMCFKPEGGTLPDGDVMLAQKIALETTEPRARAIANFRVGSQLLTGGFYAQCGSPRGEPWAPGRF